MMVAWGCAVWGSGWYYPPYYAAGALYPGVLPELSELRLRRALQPVDRRVHARGRACTDRTAAPATARAITRRTGTWARGAAAYGPGGRAWRHPGATTRAPARSARRCRDRTSTAAGDRPPCSAAINGRRRSRVTRNATGTTSRFTQGSGGGEALTRRGPQGGTTLGRTGSGDVYAGRDGNVYRNQGGTWQKYGDGGWSSAQRPVGTAGSQARDRATQSGVNRDTFSSTEQRSQRAHRRGAAHPRPQSRRKLRRGQLSPERRRQLQRWRRRLQRGWRRLQGGGRR